MASKKLSTDTSLANSYKLSRGVASVARPSAPTIGTATDTSAGLMSVTFTASTLGPTASSFTLTSSSGVTGSGASSPLTLQELATGTYTYSVSGVNANGTGPSSAASNSVVVASVYGNSFESIATSTVGAGGVSTLTFSSIPSTYQHLQIRAFAANNVATQATYLYFNGDTTLTNYYNHQYNYNGTSVTASADTTGAYPIYFTGSTSGFGSHIIDILDYANTNKFKTIRTVGGYDTNGAGYLYSTSSIWESTSAGSSITITAFGGTILQYSSFALYGIKG